MLRNYIHTHWGFKRETKTPLLLMPNLKGHRLTNAEHAKKVSLKCTQSHNRTHIQTTLKTLKFPVESNIKRSSVLAGLSTNTVNSLE